MPSRFAHPRWVPWLIAAALLIRLASLTVPRAVRSYVALGQPRNDRTTTMIARFEQIAGDLPAGTTIGYATAAHASTTEFARRYGVARYAVAPLALDATDQHAFVLADFDDDPALLMYVQRHGGVLRSHPNLGVGIIERENARR